MPAARPVVLHPNERVDEASTPGLAIHHYLGGDGRWVGFAGWVHNDAEDTSGWHHHADNDNVRLCRPRLAAGRLRVERDRERHGRSR